MICRGCFLPIAASADALKVGRFRWRWHRECWAFLASHQPMIRWPEYGPGDPDGYYPQERSR